MKCWMLWVLRQSVADDEIKWKMKQPYLIEVIIKEKMSSTRRRQNNDDKREWVKKTFKVRKGWNDGVKRKKLTCIEWCISKYVD